MKQFTIEMGQEYTIEDFPETHRDLLLACHHSGPCDADVARALPHFRVSDNRELRSHLQGYGAWDSYELRDTRANLGRLLWLMASDIQESGSAYTGE